MAHFMLEIFSKVINEVIFGNKLTEKIDGMTVPVAIEKMYELISRSLFQHPLNALSGGLLGKYKLIEPVKEAWALAERIRSVIKKEYEHRMQQRES